MFAREPLYGTGCHNHNHNEWHYLRQTFMAEGKNYALSLRPDCDVRFRQPEGYSDVHFLAQNYNPLKTG
jgi:hypothetical protein